MNNLSDSNTKHQLESQVAQPIGRRSFAKIGAAVTMGSTAALLLPTEAHAAVGPKC